MDRSRSFFRDLSSFRCPGELYRDVGGRNTSLIFLLALFFRLMADGVAALLAGGIAGTLVGMFRKTAAPD
jgi:hypothetical protein